LTESGYIFSGFAPLSDKEFVILFNGLNSEIGFNHFKATPMLCEILNAVKEGMSI
jgi:hypothetical protein